MDIVVFKSEFQGAINSFFEECFSAVGIPFSPKDRHADIANVLHYYMQDGCFWCLFDNEKLIGTVAVRVIDSENKVLELKRMFVLPQCQGKGYGKTLLQHAVSYAKEQQYKKICLDTRMQFSAAQHLYRSAGFQEADRYNDKAELYFELLL